jgi:hypothetical protein
MDDFNRLIDDVESWYGREKVVFLKVDGQILWELSSRYNVMYFPHFTAIAAGTGGAEHSHFMNGNRNYETLKEWILEVMGETPLREGCS